ncbi:golgin subfamily a member 4-like protein [Lasius niger]|uniref:Golgin subfamily a member 4-like protein n=1 Tax=Lasius niger TaxID=67767 RepID=A0A0J7NQR3_LASNI|nr:golgin subfamily a member 4-like protein [Lasius niger]
MMWMICKNKRLQGRLDECLSRVSRDVAQGVCVSYANVAGVSGASKMSEKPSVVVREKERSFAVVVTAKYTNVKMTSEQVKEKVMRDVSNSLNVRVKAVRKTRSDSVAIVSESELKRLTKCAKFGDAGLKVEMPRKIGPKVIVYDVPNESTNDDFMKEMYEKNVKGRVNEGEFKERVRIVSRNSKKDATCGNVIMEVMSNVKKIVCEEGRLYVNWKAFRVKEFVNVMRCHKCFAYGHMMRECDEKEQLCQKCGQSGHIMKECKRERECVCRNCKLRGSKCDHSVLSECPEFMRTLARERARVHDE